MGNKRVDDWLIYINDTHDTKSCHPIQYSDHSLEAIRGVSPHGIFHERTLFEEEKLVGKPGVRVMLSKDRPEFSGHDEHLPEKI
jgi:hypothetical protein